jgi:hypothetical protein
MPATFALRAHRLRAAALRARTPPQALLCALSVPRASSGAFFLLKYHFLKYCQSIISVFSQVPPQRPFLAQTVRLATTSLSQKVITGTSGLKAITTICRLIGLRTSQKLFQHATHALLQPIALKDLVRILLLCGPVRLVVGRLRLHRMQRHCLQYWLSILVSLDLDV